MAKYPGTLESNNPNEFGIVYATEVSGHKTVLVLTDLYTLSDAILSRTKNNTDNDAIGQLWFVVSENSYYKLINWNDRHSENGWRIFNEGISNSETEDIRTTLNNSKATYIEEPFTATSEKVDFNYSNYTNKWTTKEDFSKSFPIASDTLAGIITAQFKTLLDTLPDKVESSTNDLNTLREELNTLKTNFNTLLESNPNEAINSFNEIIAFLDGVQDTDTLENILSNINNQFNLKADISDLSNVKAEEVIDSSLLEEINTVTREEIKKDLFIDLWNDACGTYGTYNAETGYFELNGLTDITYEEAINIYNISNKSVVSIASRTYFGLGITNDGKGNVRTVMPLRVEMHETKFDNCFNGCRYLEAVSIIAYANVNVSPGNGMFSGCTKLKRIIGSFHSLYKTSNLTDIFKSCSSLEEVDFYSLHSNFSIADSPKLNLTSMRNFLKKTSDTIITITVHPDIYAKLTDTSNTEWNKVLTDAADKNISFVTA